MPLQTTGWAFRFGVVAFAIIVFTIVATIAFFSCKNLLRTHVRFFMINLAATDQSANESDGWIQDACCI